MIDSSADRTLARLADQLSGEGYDTSHILELRLEVEALERPPGLVTRMTTAAREAAAKHWRALVGELGESAEAMRIIAARVNGQDVSPAERDKVRSQLFDLVKMFPAGLIAAANASLPVPATGFLTPWILSRLGLMPSRWREAHLIDHLRKEAERLRQAGKVEEGAELEELRMRLEAEADDREHAAANALLLTHWDANRNGQWDPEEKQEYLQELEKMRALVEGLAHRKQWFLQNGGEIFGALRLSDLLDDDGCRDHLHDGGVLVCFDGKTGWVALPDLLGREPRF